MKWEPPFRTGDKVKFVRQYQQGWSSEGDIYSEEKLGTIHIIKEVVQDGDSPDTWEYATNRGAWYPHTCFVLHKPCSKQSIKQLLNSIKNFE